ncbi:transcriptional regulator [Gracilibacillus halophilus YIM-C55.5]|uniref:Transcriptional regulator n=1 Tax=Gracilibacillus halophilus YIM-C55.5 TaxID=1308866 RepID=N4WBH9_9BACI|nr:transcription repressor NadR [Gracilibacillus halophilus]ENH96589.1 transcriptional regulator [Gracilibacillus halophilus YIM-C55.5]
MSKKLTGDHRRQHVIEWLEQSDQPLTGSDLAKKANVSRQVIVQDITLLKAQNHPIIATSNGYLYMSSHQENQGFEKVIACKHTSEETKEELYAIVDCGAMVKDVMIEHPVYGDLKASLILSDRAEVDQFVERIEAENAPYLLKLTGGIHNHTIVANEQWKLDKAYQALHEKGFLVEN